MRSINLNAHWSSPTAVSSSLEYTEALKAKWAQKHRLEVQPPRGCPGFSSSVLTVPPSLLAVTAEGQDGRGIQ